MGALITGGLAVVSRYTTTSCRCKCLELYNGKKIQNLSRKKLLISKAIYKLAVSHWTPLFAPL